MFIEITLIIGGFLLGSISSAVVVCRLLQLPDPRKYGSHNPGATNVQRIGGNKAALIVLVIDATKGALPVFAALWFNTSLLLASLVGLASFLGHLYPIWFKFKGGKGVATFFGVLLALNPVAGLGAIATWGLVFIIGKISSLSALIASSLSAFYFYILTHDLLATFVIIIMVVLIFIRHKLNIKRLLANDES